MNVKIVKLKESGIDYLSAEKAINEIFFLSTSKKEFDDENHKRLFFKKWCGDYLENYSDWVFLCLKDNEIYGYLTGALDTTEVQNNLNVPGLEIFSDLYKDYPAHLHINFHPKARGLGLGSKLIEHFLKEIQPVVLGCHLITSPNERNVEFYKRLGFVDEFARNKNDYPLLFLGKKWTSVIG